MAPTDLPQSVKVSPSAFTALMDLRNELLQKGIDILPPHLVPYRPSMGRISISFVCEVGVLAIRQVLRAAQDNPWRGPQ